MSYKNEAVGLKAAVLHSQIKCHGDGEDVIWDIILKDSGEYNHYTLGEDGKEYIPDYEEPFVNSERPDIYYINDEFIMGIEQFQFDSSKKTKKGSNLVSEGKKVDAELMKKYYTQSEHPFSAEMEIDVQLSYSNYVTSLVTAFKQHSNNIIEYRSNLQKIAPDKKVYFAFYIEDVTSLGNYIMTEYGRETLNPLCVKELIDEIAKCTGLDYVLARVQRDYIYTLHIQQINDEFIQNLYRQSYDTSKDIFLPYKITRETNII